uniref:Uncharacterized protein n=1 Tax=Anopheles maculatus TaxID=74869 RepID=A0A182TAS3_9DIPT
MMLYLPLKLDRVLLRLSARADARSSVRKVHLSPLGFNVEGKHLGGRRQESSCSPCAVVMRVVQDDHPSKPASQLGTSSRLRRLGVVLYRLPIGAAVAVLVLPGTVLNGAINLVI